MKQTDDDFAGRAFSTIMLTAFAICLGILCFQYLFLPWAADESLAGIYPTSYWPRLFR